MSTLLQIIAPWRLEKFTQKFQGRQDLLKYASENGIPVSATIKSPWSIDANLMHISYESGILENPLNEAPQELYTMTQNPANSPDKPYRLEVQFQKGLPELVVDNDRKKYVKPLEILTFLNKIGGEYGVGRIDIVENRFIGLKVIVLKLQMLRWYRSY